MGLLSFFINGWLILIAAVMLNLLADRMGLTGWYGFLTGLSTQGRMFLSRLNWRDIAWLFIVYPMALGLAARAAFIFSQLILKK